MTLRILLLCVLCIKVNLNYADQIISEDNLTKSTENKTEGNADFFLEIENTALKDVPSGSPAHPDKWRFSGSLRQQLNYAVRDQDNTFMFSREREGIRQSRSTVSLSLAGKVNAKFDYKVSANAFYDTFYHHSSEAGVSDEEYEGMADEAEWRETYINFETVGDLWIKFGQQIIAWGQSDYTQILDLVNPRDEREFGLVDLEDSRLPVWATRVSYIGKRWGSDLVLAHEFKANRWAGDGSDFDPFIQLRGTVGIVGDEEPDVSFSDPGFLGRVFLSFPRGDVSLIYANIYDRTPALQIAEGQSSEGFLIYPEIEVFGIAANWVSGFWLLKSELARKRNTLIPRSDWPVQFSLGADQGRLYDKKKLYQLLAGVEYAGFQDVQISLEWVTNKLDKYQEILAQEEVESLLSGRLNFEYFRDTANLEIVWVHWVEGKSDSIRVSFNYDLTDTIKLSAGYIDFSANDIDSELYPYRHGDRVFAGVRYSF